MQAANEISAQYYVNQLRAGNIDEFLKFDNYIFKKYNMKTTPENANLYIRELLETDLNQDDLLLISQLFTNLNDKIQDKFLPNEPLFDTPIHHRFLKDLSFFSILLPAFKIKLQINKNISNNNDELKKLIANLTPAQILNHPITTCSLLITDDSPISSDDQKDHTLIYSKSDKKLYYIFQNTMEEITIVDQDKLYSDINNAIEARKTANNIELTNEQFIECITNNGGFSHPTDPTIDLSRSIIRVKELPVIDAQMTKSAINYCLLNGELHYLDKSSNPPVFKEVPIADKQKFIQDIEQLLSLPPVSEITLYPSIFTQWITENSDPRFEFPSNPELPFHTALKGAETALKPPQTLSANAENQNITTWLDNYLNLIQSLEDATEYLNFLENTFANSRLPEIAARKATLYVIITLYSRTDISVADRTEILENQMKNIQNPVNPLSKKERGLLEKLINSLIRLFHHRSFKLVSQYDSLFTHNLIRNTKHDDSSSNDEENSQFTQH